MRSPARARCCRRVLAALLLAILAPLLSLASGEIGAIPEHPEFYRDVQPILAEYCAGCHGGVKKKGGLSLVTRAHAFAETDSGMPAIVPGDAKWSELVARLSLGENDDDRMPPEEALPSEAIAILTRWVEEGAVWPEHWSLAMPHRPELPPVKNESWGRNEIDRFVLARLEKEGVAPSPEAGPETLIRRLSLDLVGLQPDLERVGRFAREWKAAESSPEIRDTLWRELVDEMLASPHFGERWGRHWLDEARYADSSGYEKDSTRADAWRFRDWVIGAINDDLPFDQFTIEQLAGDLLPNADEEDRIATKFHLMNQFNLEGGVDAEEDRVKRNIDRVAAVVAAWLGTSIGCVQCHNHPYDPIEHEEFYRLYAFFDNADWDAIIAGDKPEDCADRIAKRQKEWEPVAKMLEEQVTNKNLATQLQAALTKLRNYDNANGFTRVMAERTENRRSTYVFDRGNFQTPRIEAGPVHPDTPAVWPALNPRGDKAESADRLDLANWMVRDDQPLVPRVAVNKIWMHLFGAPLAGTPQDVGMRGDPPSHPELLDWLAWRFSRELGWSRKAIVREIVSSATYRQTSTHRPELEERDPDNRLLARQNRFRVEGEIVRDLSLQAAGLLSRKVGGPSVYPPVPQDVAAESYANNFKWNTSKGEDRYRRGLY
ncbi:MAG: PSD1 domain-containing protein, partial [Verrucomicrobiae bacterium]|nr:PSD1 domain-containing protein [Verrucomicrobiae bacterium]